MPSLNINTISMGRRWTHDGVFNVQKVDIHGGFPLKPGLNPCLPGPDAEVLPARPTELRGGTEFPPHSPDLTANGFLFFGDTKT
ncbi:hypothetical protein AVEN_132607-1 [Araneus ventricosus]|uniref:Uncharacterized protein n=1 Tax=Araneus ventricosus TaxID=182803 RepID=A0A4Y2AVX7_ARAVE|nr:hypothetical protein AVEN_132607-1 [Araneus ventricosus]